MAQGQEDMLSRPNGDFGDESEVIPNDSNPQLEPNDGRADRFVKTINRKFGQSSQGFEESVWRFKKIGDSKLIEKINAARETIYRRDGIYAENQDPILKKNGIDHYGVFSYFPDLGWSLETTCTIHNRYNAQLIPTELILDDEFLKKINYQSVVSNVKSKFPNATQISKSDRAKLLAALRDAKPINTIEIGGLYSPRSHMGETVEGITPAEYMCPLVNLRFVWGVAETFYRNHFSNNPEGSLLIQTTSAKHSRFYDLATGLRYVHLAGRFDTPYIDVNGREAVTLGLGGSSFHENFHAVKKDTLCNALVESMFSSDDFDMQNLANVHF